MQAMLIEGVVVDGQVSLMGIERRNYFKLNVVGSRIWQLIESPKRVGEISAAVADEFDVDRERCDADTLALVRHLLEQGLAESPESGDVC